LKNSFLSTMILLSIVSAEVIFAKAPAKKATITELNQLIKGAINNNPDLKSQKLQWQSLIQQYPQAVALSDPKISYTEAINPIETRLGPQDRVLSLNQKIPYKGKRGLKGELVKKEVKIAKARYEKASRDLVVEIKKSFYELVYIENAIRLSLQNKKVLERITHIATTDYASNASTLNDVAKGQSQYAQVSYDVQVLEELRSTEKTRLNTLLNRNPDHRFNINTYARSAPKFAHSLPNLYKWSDQNDEIKMAGFAVEKSQVQEKLARYSSRPDFDIGVRYTQIGESDIAGVARSGRDAVAISFGMSLPIYTKKTRAIKEQARLNTLRKKEDIKAIKNSLHNNVKVSVFKLKNSQRLVTLYGKNLIPQANRAMQIAQLQYRENKGSIAKYLETQSTWLNFQLAYQRAIADAWKSLIQLEKLTGRKL
ncbi:MAG: TolC family protein, partial [Cocleimonas sp.]